MLEQGCLEWLLTVSIALHLTRRGSKHVLEQTGLSAAPPPAMLAVCPPLPPAVLAVSAAPPSAVLAVSAPPPPAMLAVSADHHQRC